jgi:hypothetical protein
MSLHHSLLRLKAAAEEPPTLDQHKGMRDRRLVLTKDLQELLRDYERIDSLTRDSHFEIQRLRKLNQTLEGMKREHN